MFLVKTILAPSKIHGLGVFTNQHISEGEQVISLEYELCFTSDALHKLPPIVRQYIMHHSYKRTGRWFLPMDNERFLNHSDKPNLIYIGPEYSGEVAARDIEQGEELTVNYHTYDEREVF